MEVECSKNEETTPFCTRNEVRSYPVLTLFTGMLFAHGTLVR